jgi:hypothetical protein
VAAEEGEEAFAICKRVRRTSWGYVASDAIILEAAEHIRIVDGDSEDWFPSGSVCQLPFSMIHVVRIGERGIDPRKTLR